MNNKLTSIFLALASLVASVANAQDKSVYDDIPEFGGPGSVGVQLKADNRAPETGDFVKDGLPGWFASKQNMLEQHGLAYGLNLSTPLPECKRGSRRG